MKRGYQTFKSLDFHTLIIRKMSQPLIYHNQAHSQLCKSRLRETAITYLKDDSQQSELLEKLLNLLGHFGKFRTRIEELNYEGLVSISNWRSLTLTLVQRQSNTIDIIRDNLDSKALSSIGNLFKSLNDFTQGVAAFAQASYSLLVSLRHHLYSDYLINGGTALYELFDKLDPESFLEDFSSKYCGELFDLSRKITEAHEDYEYFTTVNKESHKTRTKALEILITILSHASPSIGNSVKDRRIDGSRLSRIVEGILSWLENHSQLAAPKNRSHSDLVRSFLVSLDSTFNTRLRKIEKANLHQKIGRQNLNEDQVKTFYDIDKATLGSIFANFVIFVVNPSLPTSKQLDVGQQPRDLWQQLNPHHQAILQTQISKRIGSLFFDQKHSAKQGNNIPAAHLFAEELKKASKLPLYTPESSPSLNTNGIIEIADDSIGFDSLASLLKALRRIAPNFEKQHPKLRFHRVIFLAKQVRRGLLIVSQDKTSPRFFSFASTDSLTGSDWHLSEYTPGK